MTTDREALIAEAASEGRWANHYAERVGLLEAALQNLVSAYSGKHSPQHRKACLVEAEAVLRGAQGGEQSASQQGTLKSALEGFRDAVLNQRGALAENGMNGDQVNDVLSEFDNILGPFMEQGGEQSAERQLAEQIERRVCAEDVARQAEAERDALKHDIERALETSTELATECERLRESQREIAAALGVPGCDAAEMLNVIDSMRDAVDTLAFVVAASGGQVRVSPLVMVKSYKLNRECDRETGDVIFTAIDAARKETS